MKARMLCNLILVSSLTMPAQVKKVGPPPSTVVAANQKTIENQKAIDSATAELNGILTQSADVSAQLTTLDKSDADLKKSDQSQIDTSQMVQTQLNRLRNETLPAIQGRANAWDIKRQNHINSGCPAEGGRMPIDQANRCNAETDALMAERGKILADGDSALQQKRQYESLRDSVTATTLANAAKEKANNAQRDALNAKKAELGAAKKRLEATLEGLKKGIDSCAKLLLQRGASCEKIKAQCGNIQFDGADPDLPASVYDSPCGKLPAGKPRPGAVTANR